MDSVVSKSLLLALVLNAISLTAGCKVSYWESKSMEWRLFQSDLVVYGKDVGHIISPVPESRQMNQTDMIFHVSCIIKGDAKDISEMIIIEQVKPRHTCSGTDIDELDDEIIVSLRRQDNGNYTLDETNTWESAAFNATKKNFEKASRVCGLQDARPPKDRPQNSTFPGCPAELIFNGTKPVCTNGGNGSNAAAKHSGTIVTSMIGIVLSLYSLFV